VAGGGIGLTPEVNVCVVLSSVLLTNRDNRSFSIDIAGIPVRRKIFAALRSTTAVLDRSTNYRRERRGDRSETCVEWESLWSKSVAHVNGTIIVNPVTRTPSLDLQIPLKIAHVAWCATKCPSLEQCSHLPSPVKGQLGYINGL
jgi:hypothetical protein